MPDFTPRRFESVGPGRRGIEPEFSGRRISSDGCAVLLAQADQQRRALERLDGCFVDHRNPERIEHSIEGLLRQRLYALALCYKDVNDQDELPQDALLAAVVGKADPTGEQRSRQRDRG